MTSKDPLIFQVTLVRKMADRLAARVRGFIESETLKRSLRVRVRLDRKHVGADLYIPQYWAVYYHDGRGPVRPRNGKFIVYFANIEDDPRVSGGKSYPVRAAQIRRLRLDPEEFRRLVREGKLVVKRSVGPVQGSRFFERLGGKAARIAAPIVSRDFRGHLRASLGNVLRLRGSLRLRPFF